MACGNLSEPLGNHTLTEILPLAVAYSASDARSLRALNPKVRAVLVLTPDALAELSGGSFFLIVLTRLLTDRCQAAIVARLRRLDRWVMAQCEDLTTLGAGGRSAFRHDIYAISGLAMALLVALGRQGPWLVPDAQGWRCVEDRQDALNHLVRAIGAHDGGFRPAIGAPPLPWLLRLLGWLVPKLLAGRRAMVITCRRYGFPNLASQALAHGLVPVEIRTAVGNWRDLLYSIRGGWKGLCGGQSEWTIVAVPRRDPVLVAALGEIWERLPNPFLRQALEPYRSLVMTETELTNGSVDHMQRILMRMNVAAILGHSFRWSSEAALGQAAGRLGIARLLLSHGSHPDGQTRAAAHPHAVLADGLLVSGLADLSVVQSPIAARAAKQLMPDLPQLATRPIMWGYKTPHLPSGADRPLRILHAGTYKRLSGWRPWIYETSLEYVQGLEELAQAVIGLEGVELVIRVREAPECSVSTLRRLLPHHPRVQIKTDGSFLEDLAEADLLVSYASTTIEEALAAARPVLLWGGSLRYQHLPARLVPPSAQDRGAVYSVTDAEDLPGMISAVLAAHAGQPLTRHEVVCLVADPSLPDAAQLVRLMDQGFRD